MSGGKWEQRMISVLSTVIAVSPVLVLFFKTGYNMAPNRYEYKK